MATPRGAFEQLDETTLCCIADKFDDLDSALRFAVALRRDTRPIMAKCANFADSCKYGSLIMAKRYPAEYIMSAIRAAARYNHREVVDYLLSLGANAYHGLNGACLGGHRDLAEYLISRGVLAFREQYADLEACDLAVFHEQYTDLEACDLAEYAAPCSDDLIDSLGSACRGGHRDIAERLIEIGAIPCDSMLYDACEGGHRDIAEWLITEHGVTRFNSGLSGACFGGHRDIAENMIARGANDFNHALRCACYGGHRVLAERMVELGATNLTEAAANAMDDKPDDPLDEIDASKAEDRIKIVEFLVSRGAIVQ